MTHLSPSAKRELSSWGTLTLILDLSSPYTDSTEPSADTVHVYPPEVGLAKGRRKIGVPSRGPAPRQERLHNPGPRTGSCTRNTESAPRDWFMDVKNVLMKCGFTQRKSDPCLFLLSHEGKTCGLIAMHVDDFLLAGEESNKTWTLAVEQFRQAFRRSPWEQPPFTHCGVEVHQLPDFSFKLGHSSYCEELKQIEIDKTSSHITDGERSQARALLGAAQWRVQQTAPQHAAKLSMLQSSLPRGGKVVLTAINKLCREIYAQRHLSVATLHLGHEFPEDLVFVCWTDAAVGNRPDLSSTGGYLVALASPQLLSGRQGLVNPIAWRSGKLHRVARSSLSAEIQALAEGEQELMACRLQWAEMLGRAPDLRQPWNPAAVSDAKSVWDAFQKGDTATAMFSMKEKYAVLELMAVEESMTRTNTPLLWVSSEAQLADGLTKAQAQDLLRDFLQRGQLWNVKYDPNSWQRRRRSILPRSLHFLNRKTCAKLHLYRCRQPGLSPIIVWVLCQKVSLCLFSLLSGKPSCQPELFAATYFRLSGPFSYKLLASACYGGEGIALQTLPHSL